MNIPKCCSTCEYMDMAEMICRNIFSDEEWREVTYDGYCDKWSLSDIAKMIYEGEEDEKTGESVPGMSEA